MSVAVETDHAADVEELVSAAAGGNEAAWAELVHRYTPVLRNAVRTHRLNDADAADVMQNTWLRMVENVAKIRESRAVGGWLRTTALRESHRVHRYTGRVAPVADLDESARIAPVPGPEVDVERQDRVRRLRAAVAGLSAADQRLLGVLLGSPQPSYTEVAARLGRPVGSIGPSRARCLARLRRNLIAAGLDHAS